MGTIRTLSACLCLLLGRVSQRSPWLFLRRLIPEHDHKLFTWTDEPLDPPSSNTRSWTREMELGGGCCYCPDGTDE